MSATTKRVTAANRITTAPKAKQKTAPAERVQSGSAEHLAELHARMLELGSLLNTLDALHLLAAYGHHQNAGMMADAIGAAMKELEAPFHQACLNYCRWQAARDEDAG